MIVDTAGRANVSFNSLASGMNAIRKPLERLPQHNSMCEQQNLNFMNIRKKKTNENTKLSGYGSELDLGRVAGVLNRL